MCLCVLCFVNQMCLCMVLTDYVGGCDEMRRVAVADGGSGSWWGVGDSFLYFI